jgi:hypothetical protein
VYHEGPLGQRLTLRPARLLSLRVRRGLGDGRRGGQLRTGVGSGVGRVVAFGRLRLTVAGLVVEAGA